jgi:hypothetical protein
MHFAIFFRMTTRTKNIIGWIPAVLVSLFLIIASGLPKFFIVDGTPTADFVNALGAGDILYPVGALEILCGILLLIPRTMTVGFIVTVGLLGGATATGLTHNVEGNWPWFPMVLILILTFSAYFRTPELLARLRGKKI